MFHMDESIEGDNTHVAVTYANFGKGFFVGLGDFFKKILFFCQVLKIGDTVLVDDGLIALTVDKIEDDKV